MTDLVLPSRLTRYFQDYSAHHTTRGNKLTHALGIPLIVLSVLGLLADWIIFDFHGTSVGNGLVRVDGGGLLLALSLLWYAFLDWRIAVPFGLVLGGLYLLGRACPTFLLVIFFSAGWALQFVGHGIYEKKSPAFLSNVRHLLIGPLYIFAWTVGYID